jgi:hypothetical protein
MDFIDTESRIRVWYKSDCHRATQTDGTLFDWAKDRYMVIPFDEYKNMAQAYYNQTSDIALENHPTNFKG